MGATLGCSLWCLLAVASLVAEHRRWGVHAPVLAARRLAQYCGVQASAAVAMGSVALRHVESSQTGRGTCVLCISRQILNHWTTREVPVSTFLAIVNSASVDIQV